MDAAPRQSAELLISITRQSSTHQKLTLGAKKVLHSRCRRWLARPSSPGCLL